MFGNDGFFSKFSPKTSFFLGLGLAGIIFFLIGSGAILGFIIKDKTGNDDKNSPVASNTAPAPAPNPEAEKPKEIELAPISDADWVLGPRDAKISFVEFSDLECPICKDFHAVMERLVKEYPKDINWVFRHFPLTRHPKATKEAEAAECAGELGGNEKFWAYINRLFEITPSNNGLDTAELPKIAQFVGLNRDQFQECLDSGRFTRKVQDQGNQALTAGAGGTPYTVIFANGQKIPIGGMAPDAFEQIKGFVDSQLTK